MSLLGFECLHSLSILLMIFQVVVAEEQVAALGLFLSVRSVAAVVVLVVSLAVEGLSLEPKQDDACLLYTSPSPRD